MAGENWSFLSLDWVPQLYGSVDEALGRRKERFLVYTLIFLRERFDRPRIESTTF